MSAPRTYLDWNASAPLRDEARDAMLPAMDVTGNPSSVHAEGRKARAAVEDARERVAELAGAKPTEVFFTSGATEANNWVLAEDWSTIVLSGIEHDSVLAPARASAAELVEVPAARNGTVRIEDLIEHIRPASKRCGRPLVILQLANNETGVIQPVGDVAACAREHGWAMHTDATQAAGRMQLDFRGWDVNSMALSSHKLGGPKGVGALIIREGSAIAPFIVGGGQQQRRRGGTEDVAGIVGFGAAASAAMADLRRIADIVARRDLIERGLARFTPEISIVGKEVQRLPNTSCVIWPGKLAETLVIKLDLAGVAVSSGSACSSGKVGASHVLTAMGFSPDLARSAIRISIGPQTSRRDILRLFGAWVTIRGPGAVESDHERNEMPIEERYPFAKVLEGV